MYLSIEHHSSETVITDCTDGRTKVIIVTIRWNFIDILYMAIKHNCFIVYSISKVCMIGNKKQPWMVGHSIYGH